MGFSYERRTETRTSSQKQVDNGSGRELSSNLSVAENIYLGRESSRGWIIEPQDSRITSFGLMCIV
jgi:hypothetical protein